MDIRLAASCFSIAGHYTGAGMVMHNGVKIIKPIIFGSIGVAADKSYIGNVVKNKFWFAAGKRMLPNERSLLGSCLLAFFLFSLVFLLQDIFLCLLSSSTNPFRTSSVLSASPARQIRISY